MFLGNYIVSEGCQEGESLRELLAAGRRGELTCSDDHSDAYAKIVPVEGPFLCPRCSNEMISNGSGTRTVHDAGTTYHFRVRQYRCKKCERERREKNDPTIQYTHRLLPENMFPYKRTATDVMITCGMLGEQEDADPPDTEAMERAEAAFEEKCCDAEEKTLQRWKAWFRGLRRWLSGTLAKWAAKLQAPQFKERADTIDRGHATSGQLEAAVRDILFLEGGTAIQLV